MAVGKLRPAYREAADEYLRRLARYLKVEEREVKEAGKAGSSVEARRREAELLRSKLPTGALVIALERTGTPWSSEEVAVQLGRWELAARPIAVVLGGSTGLDPGFLGEADARWSLGALTLPHELARVVVLEQLYRACTIRRGEQYHK